MLWFRQMARCRIQPGSTCCEGGTPLPPGSPLAKVTSRQICLEVRASRISDLRTRNPARPEFRHGLLGVEMHVPSARVGGAAPRARAGPLAGSGQVADDLPLLQASAQSIPGVGVEPVDLAPGFIASVPR